MHKVATEESDEQHIWKTAIFAFVTRSLFGRADFVTVVRRATKIASLFPVVMVPIVSVNTIPSFSGLNREP